MLCKACGGPYHESTGHAFNENFVICGRCAISFKDWLKGRMRMANANLRNKETGFKYKESFGEAASKSIIGDNNG